jgi:hypothetical protein
MLLRIRGLLEGRGPLGAKAAGLLEPRPLNGA